MTRRVQRTIIVVLASLVVIPALLPTVDWLRMSAAVVFLTLGGWFVATWLRSEHERGSREDQLPD